MIGRIDGGSVEAAVKTQRLLEEFGQEKSSIRILLASDMASEGLNLHFQSHRLIHFDLPWSLLRFQQRNGRIDRYDGSSNWMYAAGRRASGGAQ
jgi:superfamily II DNA/RNA helicase